MLVSNATEAGSVLMAYMRTALYDHFGQLGGLAVFAVVGAFWTCLFGNAFYLRRQLFSPRPGTEA